MATTNDYPQLLEIDVDEELHLVMFTANGEHIIGAGQKGVRVWRVKDGKQVATLAVVAYHVAASKDGKYVAGGTSKGELLVWDATTYEQVSADRAGDGAIQGIDFSPDSARLVCGGKGTATICVIPGCQKVQTLDHNPGRVSARYAPRDSQIATANQESVRVWDSNDGRVLVDVKIPASGLLWCSNHPFVLTKDGEMKRINPANGSILSEWPVPYTDSQWCMAMPQHGGFVTHATKKAITLWETVTHSQLCLIQHAHDIRLIACSAVGQLLLFTAERKIIVKDLSSVVSRFVLEPDLDIDSATLDTWKRGQLTDAEALLTAAIPTAGDSLHHVLASRALVRTRLGRWDEALVDAKQSLGNQQSLVGYIAKCAALVGTGEKGKGIHICDIAARHFPDHAVLLNLAKAVVVSIDGNHANAISRVVDLVIDGRADPALYTVQAYMHLLQGNKHMEGRKYKHAAQSFEDARRKLGSGTRRPPEIVSLMSGWKFDDLAYTSQQHLCEALFAMGRTKEAAESLLTMLDDVVDMTEPTKAWVSDFKARCFNKLVELGDRATHVRQYAEADSHYSLALSLDLADSQDLLNKRDNTRPENKKWEDALNAANEAIKLDPSSPSGYKEKCTALHGMGCDKDAVDAFETMLSKMSESSDPEIREQADLYSRAKGAIGKAVEKAVSDLPFMLINALSGRLCDEMEQATAFKFTPAFTSLVMSMSTHIDQARIEKEVGEFYRYATFSHTWEGDEPPFEKGAMVYELEASPTHDKLRMFCKIARELGFNWAWSDICCIDKNDPSLRQKSIVLIFKWYEGSAMTIIFLYDVDKDAGPGSLTKSRWFSRGWAFQEYHASKVVRIYTKDWTPYLGLTIHNHKESPEVISEVEKATGMSAQALKLLRPGLNNIREKLCLASTRKTKEVEDAAYSLFGIFSMTDLRITYGEGDMALGRLLARLLVDSGDTSILAWTGTSGSFNSCLPTNIIVFNPPPTSHIPRAIDDVKMGKLTAKLRSRSLFDLDRAIELYDRLSVLSIPYFQGQRLKLPCLAFRITDVSTFKEGSQHVLRLQSGVLEGAVDIKTEEKLLQQDSPGALQSLMNFFLRPLKNLLPQNLLPQSLKDPQPRKEFVLVYPWVDFLLDRRTANPSPPSAVSPMEKQALVYRFLARLKQPSGALLLIRTRPNIKEYARIASASSIKVQVGEITSERLKELTECVQTLDVL